MRYNQFSVVQHIVAHHGVQKMLHILDKCGRLAFQFRQGIFQTVIDGDIGSLQFAQQFYIMLPGTQRAEPAPTICMASLRVGTIFGPLSTRSPRKTAFLPRGG